MGIQIVNTTYKPILAPNESINLEMLKYPLLVSTKLDGIRCIFYKGEILSRSLKPIQNEQLRNRFEPLRKYSEQSNVILDGEIYSPKRTFQSITHFVMTQNLETEVLPEDLKFYCFDTLIEEKPNEPFNKRSERGQIITQNFSSIAEYVVQREANSEYKVLEIFETVLNEGYEGLILRDPEGRYKFGRGTVKEGLIYKLKPFVTFESQITGIVQSTAVNEEAEKKTNELGRSVTSKKKDDRHVIEKASAFWVKYEGKDLKVTLAMTDEEKEEVWKNKTSYIGKTIEYKGMMVGAKDVPRHPVMLRFRQDKD